MAFTPGPIVVSSLVVGAAPAFTAFDGARTTTSAAVAARCLERRVFVRQTHGTGIRVFPALTITRDELWSGLRTLEEAVAAVAG